MVAMLGWIRSFGDPCDGVGDAIYGAFEVTSLG